jgi:tetratricopeptide (TPR) repeat protein
MGDNRIGRRNRLPHIISTPVWSICARSGAGDFACLLLLSAIPMFAAVPEEPVGLVLNAGGGQLLRSDAETPLSARPGDLLFSGDGLRTSSNTASFLFCPGKTLQTLSSSGEVRLDASKPKVRTGTISGQPARACTLPKTLRVAAASQQHYGVTMTRGVAGELKPIARAALPADVLTELAPFDGATDPAALIGAANVFETHNLPANALELYYRLRAQWPDAAWLKSKIFDLEQSAAAQSVAAPAAGGQTYALIIGVSKYQRPELSLQYAHADATTFSQLIASPRGGGVPASNILLLTDEKATTAAVRNGFQDFLKRRATKNDTVIILIAGHGTVEGNRGAYILTHDSDPQDLASTALPMAELQALFEDQLQKVGKVLLFVDVCKAGTIGSIQSTGINSNVQQLGEVEGDLFGLLASRPREVSFEGPEFGGGHGAFSYFVLKGMGGAADADGNKTVTASELIDYVSKQVPAATNSKQHPREFGVYDNGMRMAEVDKPGIELARTPPMIDVRTGEPLYLAQTAPQPLSGQAARDLDAFNAALAAGRFLPGEAGNAFDALRPLAASFTPQRYLETQNQLRIALENAAQRVLLKYLQGDQTPPVREDFALAARYMDAARTLTRESLYLEARDTFFQGRALLFDKRYAEAAPLLEQSVRLDPGAAYSYNALGIAYLEQARFDEAIPAFRDAANRAQHWSYPLHNLALSYVETGDYQSAIRAYQRAIDLTPEYSYLPYNLGLVYQRLNRRKDAERSYQRAIQIAPASAEPYNALGTLKASENKSADAERLYRDALQRNPALLPARHNLAVLLAAQPTRRDEAAGLLRENLQRDPRFLASQLSLAETLEASADSAGAIAAYRASLALAPNYSAARLALARLLLASGDTAGAAAEAQQAGPENFAALELLGDVRSKQSLTADARAAYQAALALKPERADRKRMERKLTLGQ